MSEVARRRFAGALLFGATLLAPTGARAEEDPAGTLFGEGLDAMDKGRFAEACTKIARSQELDPRPGTLFTLAECEWKWGKTASALGHYESYLALLSGMPPEQRGKQRDRETVARSQSKALASQVPRVTFAVTPATAGITYAIDGTTVSGDGKDVRVDPGEHTVTATGPKGKRSERFKVQSGEHARVTVNLAAAGSGDRPFFERLDARPDKTTLYVAGGLGAAGLVTGVVFTALTFGAKSTVSDHCGIAGNDRACDAEGKEAADRGKTFGWIATAGFGVAAVGIITAVALWYARGDAAKSAALRPPLAF